VQVQVLSRVPLDGEWKLEIARDPSKSKTKKPSRRRNPYDSNDPFTQAKYLFDLHAQTGNPISWAQAYRDAVEIAEENAQDMKRSQSV
jgi:hypothetical protein